MSEQNMANQDGTFNIFDLGSSTPTADPFAGMEDTTPQAAPVTELAELQQAVQTSEPEQSQKIEPNPAPEAQPEVTNPLAAAMEEAEKKQATATADSLFSKAPVFEYAAATDEIKDTGITFEQLRVEKATDFPELDDGKRVSWTMEYGKIVKTVSAPNKTVIGKMKKEIENSKEFLDALIKSKDKNPTCKVKPRITAQSKGIAGYKGVFANMEEAEASDKHIRILPARDGHVYEIRCTEAGKFIAPTENVKELSEVNAGFKPALPPVSFSIFSQVLTFFRYYMRDGRESEVMVYVYWDKQEQGYRISVPMQKVGPAHISVVIPTDETIDADRYIHVADIHSHNRMPAFFSGTDDRNELATRVYIVVGRLNQDSPEIRARVSVGGRFVNIDARQVVEIPTMLATLPAEFHPVFHIQQFTFTDNTDFPPEWISMVHVMESTGNLPAEAQVSQARAKSLWAGCLNRLKGRAGCRKVRDYEI